MNSWARRRQFSVLLKGGGGGSDFRHDGVVEFGELVAAATQSC